MKNCMICFSNIKGGVGKTHLAAIFCNYLVEHEIPVAVIDADTQQSLTRRRERELSQHPEATSNWECHRLDPMNEIQAQALLPQLKSIPGVVVVDCPGSVTDPALKHLIPNSDIIVIPFEQDDEDVIDATILYGESVKKVTKSALFFVPNKVSIQMERREYVQAARERAYHMIVKEKKLGYLTQYVKQSVDIKNYSTTELLTDRQRYAVSMAFQPILERIKSKM